jgi:hypothetical protein
MVKDGRAGPAAAARASPRRRRGGAIGYAVVAVLWLGLLLGVSFLATPVKFLAPSLSLPVALDVGRHTFAAFDRVEIVLAVALLACALAGRLRWPSAGLALGLGAAVAVQALWLLPALDARVETILQGGMPPASILHVVYIGLDAIKAAALAIAAFLGFRQLPAI